jgi:hypothetical protein
MLIWLLGKVKKSCEYEADGRDEAGLPPDQSAGVVLAVPPSASAPKGRA